MKRQIAILLGAAILPAMLTGCGKQSTKQRSVQQQDQTVTEITENGNTPERGGTEITIDRLFPNAHLRTQPPFPGVRRRFEFDRTGVYTVEYIHTPYGVESDDTLDYRLELSDDNTYTMKVTANGVTAAHNGKWYNKRDTLMLFYDEPIDQPTHNTYVADSMYCEIIPQGKLLIYDRCYTVILSKSQQDTPAELSRSAKAQAR